MVRKCSKCGTKFNENRFSKFSIDVIDPTPECWDGGTQNGICVKCCSCHKNHKIIQ